MSISPAQIAGDSQFKEIAGFHDIANDLESILGGGTERDEFEERVAVETEDFGVLDAAGGGGSLRPSDKREFAEVLP